MGAAIGREQGQIRFMRQDIMANVDKIMQEGIISQPKFQLVMRTFMQDLYMLSDRVLNMVSGGGDNGVVYVPVVHQ